MKQKRFHNAPPPPAEHSHLIPNGFTLVEISIVMIIIGLLIGGIFGGMKLVDNANVQKTIQDIKAIESATLTFRDTYRALPGDIRNPDTRIANCTVAPCSTSGNGNRRLDPTQASLVWNGAIDATMERFTFWSQLQAANLIQMDFSNTTTMTFGDGQPSSPIGGGYRMTDFGQGGWNNGASAPGSGNTKLMITGSESADMNSPAGLSLSCVPIKAMDLKVDDGDPVKGKIIGWGCAFATGSCCTGPATNSTYAADPGGTSTLWYNLAF